MAETKYPLRFVVNEKSDTISFAIGRAQTLVLRCLGEAPRYACRVRQNRRPHGVAALVEPTMTIRAIHNDDDHARAMAEIGRLWDADPGTPEHDELEVLGVLVAAYEEK